jgi:lipid A 3-O-deacylase
VKRLAYLAALICAVFLTTGERAAAQVRLNETPAVLSTGVGWYDLVLEDNEAVPH